MMKWKDIHFGIEALRFLLVLGIGLVLFLFFTLILDVIGWVAYGGWNPLLGSWPIFASTVSITFYGGKAAVAILIISYGILCRMVAGPVNFGVLHVLGKGRGNGEQLEEGPEK
jgi:hypothetical protein